MTLDAAAIAPLVTWGTSPEDVVPITGAVPDPADAADDGKRQSMQRALDYMGLTPGTPMRDVPHRTRLHRLLHQRPDRGSARRRRGRAAAARWRRASARWSCPAPGLVKHQAEAEGLDAIFLEAGFEWREPGCSMCLAMNADRLEPGERCASTSNRNFEGRQGRGGRTHLMSPAMAAAAAITGQLTDVRELS